MTRETQVRHMRASTALVALAAAVGGLSLLLVQSMSNSTSVPQSSLNSPRRSNVGPAPVGVGRRQPQGSALGHPRDAWLPGRVGSHHRDVRRQRAQASLHARRSRRSHCFTRLNCSRLAPDLHECFDRDGHSHRKTLTLPRYVTLAHLKLRVRSDETRFKCLTLPPRIRYPKSCLFSR